MIDFKVPEEKILEIDKFIYDITNCNDQLIINTQLSISLPMYELKKGYTMEELQQIVEFTTKYPNYTFCEAADHNIFLSDVPISKLRIRNDDDEDMEYTHELPIINISDKKLLFYDFH